MAYQHKIQYIRIYTDGSAAKELKPVAPETAYPPLPKTVRRRRAVIRIDPVAILGTVVAVVMLVCMLLGVAQLERNREENARLRTYVSELQTENQALRTEYENGYDLETVRQTAHEMGLVPIDRVAHVRIQVQDPAAKQETPSAFEQFMTTLADLFA